MTHRPPPSLVPDWSEETSALFADLTPLERAVTEWMAAGYSATESYRRAVGRNPPSARQSGHQITRRPRVAAALNAALNDRNVGARLDREWVLMKVLALVEDCERRGGVRATRRLIEALQLIVKMQGWLGGRRPRRPPAPTTIAASEPSRHIDHLVAQAEAAIAAATKMPASGVGYALQGSRTPGPLTAGGEPPQRTGIPVAAAGGDQLASVTGRAGPRPRGYIPAFRESFMGVA